MSRLEYEVWVLADVRHKDECLKRYASQDDAQRELRRLAQLHPEWTLELRRLGRSVEAPASRRSGRPLASWSARGSGAPPFSGPPRASGGPPISTPPISTPPRSTPVPLSRAEGPPLVMMALPDVEPAIVHRLRQRGHTVLMVEADQVEEVLPDHPCVVVVVDGSARAMELVQRLEDVEGVGAVVVSRTTPRSLPRGAVVIGPPLSWTSLADAIEQLCPP